MTNFDVSGHEKRAIKIDFRWANKKGEPGEVSIKDKKTNEYFKSETTRTGKIDKFKYF